MTCELGELGVTHALASVLLLDLWHQPEDLISVVKGCHLPVVSSERPEAALVFVSGQIARLLDIGADAEPAEPIPGDVRAVLGIESDTVSALLDSEFEEFVTGALAEIRTGVAV